MESIMIVIDLEEDAEEPRSEEEIFAAVRRVMTVAPWHDHGLTLIYVGEG